MLAGCGDRVSIPTGNVGKQMTSSGLEDEVRDPGSFRLDWRMFGASPKLITLQTAENTVSVPGGYIIPRSNNLSIDIELLVRFRPKGDVESINEIYRRVPPTQGNVGSHTGAHGHIASSSVFDIFIKPTLRDTVRAGLRPYTVEELMSNLLEVREHVEKVVKASLANEPVEILSLTFNTVNWPETVTSSINKTAQVEFDKIARLRQVQADIIVAQAQRRLDLYQAQVDTEIDAVVSEFMGARMATWRMLEVMKIAAETEGTDLIVHPGMFPQGTFNFASDDTVASENIKAPEVPSVDDLIPENLGPLNQDQVPATQE